MKEKSKRYKMNGIKSLIQGKFDAYIDLVIVFGGNILSSCLNFLFIIYLARKLGVVFFGQFNIIIEIIGMITILTDLGITTGFIRFYSKYYKESKEKANALIKATFALKSGLSIFLLITTLLFSFIFIKDEKMLKLLKLASLGILTVTVNGFFCSILQSRQEFKKFILIKMINPLIKIIGLSVIIFFNIYSLENIIIIYYLSPLIMALVVYKNLEINLFDRGKINITILKELLNFSKWITLSSLAVAFLTRLDILMLSHYSSNYEVGYYSGGQKLAMIMPIITGTMTTVLLPRISVLKTNDEIRKYFKKSLKMSSFVVVPLIIGIIVAKPLIIIIFGEKYIGSIGVFRILLISYMFSVFANPISLILYNYGKTKSLAIMNCLQLIINFTGNIFLIKKFGAVGAANSTTLVKIFGFIYILSKVLLIIKKNKPNDEKAFRISKKNAALKKI